MVKERLIMDINTEKIKLHEEVILGMHDLYIKKNADYGDSFEKVRTKFPNAILIRLNDKLSRLEQVLESGVHLVDETVDETLIDLANYCVLELIERKMDRKYLEMYHTRLAGTPTKE
jgi:hypothetical protein